MTNWLENGKQIAKNKRYLLNTLGQFLSPKKPESHIEEEMPKEKEDIEEEMPKEKEDIEEKMPKEIDEKNEDVEEMPIKSALGFWGLGFFS